jgi:hypothetical protein
MQGVAPLDLVKDGAMLLHQQCVIKAFSEGGLDATDRLPVGGAEVGTKHESYLEEQVVDKEVREGTSHIGVVLCLEKNMT